MMPTSDESYEGSEAKPVEVTPEGKKPKAGTVAAGRYVFQAKHPGSKVTR